MMSSITRKFFFFFLAHKHGVFGREMASTPSESHLWTGRKKELLETSVGFRPKEKTKSPSNGPDERARTGTVPSHKVIRMAHGTAAYPACCAKPMVETERISSLSR
jgi:hypothetical protein